MGHLTHTSQVTFIGRRTVGVVSFAAMIYFTCSAKNYKNNKIFVRSKKSKSAMKIYSIFCKTRLDVLSDGWAAIPGDTNLQMYTLEPKLGKILNLFISKFGLNNAAFSHHLKKRYFSVLAYYFRLLVSPCQASCLLRL